MCTRRSNGRRTYLRLLDQLTEARVALADVAKELGHPHLALCGRWTVNWIIWLGNLLRCRALAVQSSVAQYGAVIIGRGDAHKWLCD